jgi:hypothetical protein
MEETMYIITAPCWKCKQEMKVAVIRGDFDKRGATTTGPEKFTEREFALAREHGVLIKDQYSATTDENYFANTCGNCNAFVGAFHLFTNYLNPAQLGNYPYDTIQLNA